MSFHARLRALYEEGHRANIPDLMSDTHFYAQAERTADAAVLIAITNAADPAILLTKRPNSMPDHPGQVAFPGGKLERGETATQAALREAHEELALDPSDVSLVGITDRYKTATGFDITPVLGVIPPDLPITPHPREVEAWFEFPVRRALDPKTWMINQVSWRGEQREYLETYWQGFRIWGVTAAIIFNLSRRISVEDLLDG